MADLGSQELEQMYQEVILDASRHPHGRGTLTSEGDPAAIGGEATVTAVHESCLRSTVAPIQSDLRR